MGYSESRDKRKAAMVAHVLDFKTKNPCCICGEKEPVVLQFHHIDPTNKLRFVPSNHSAKGGVGYILDHVRGMTALEAELAKCIVLCANCHIKLHAGIIKI